MQGFRYAGHAVSCTADEMTLGNCFPKPEPIGLKGAKLQQPVSDRSDQGLHLLFLIEFGITAQKRKGA